MFEVSCIFKTHFIASVTVKMVVKESIVDAGAYADTAGAIYFEEALLAAWPLGWFQGQVGDDAANPSGAARIGDEHVVESKGTQPRSVSHVAVGPVAHEPGLVEVVGRGHVGGFEAFLSEDRSHMGIDLRDQLIGFYVGAAPSFRAEAPGNIAPDQVLLKRKEVSDYGFGI